MREIVLDTETTGLDPADGHRIVEIGAVELHNHMPTGRQFHEYINPERPMPEEAFAVHGLGDDFLRTKPVFARISQAFAAFVGEARLVIHNADFDMKFLNAEFTRLSMPTLPMTQALDTVSLARRRFPGAPASLDALCRRFGIDNTARTLHGALLDAEILAEVYLELIGGRQPGLSLGAASGSGPAQRGTAQQAWRPGPRPRALPSRITAEEAEAHATMVARLGEKSLWPAD
ncbi:MAG: DNA polymerase III subunit epsilon [Armatimonadota bacterium]